MQRRNRCGVECELKKLTVPCVHMNGTSKTSLQEALIAAVYDLQKARKSLIETAPHARDYYVISDTAYLPARAEYISRLTRLKAVEDELTAIYGAIDAGRTEATVKDAVADDEG